METFRTIKLVWLRYFAVFRKNLVFASVTTFFEPLLYLISFGYGVGGMIGEVESAGRIFTYRQFVFAGIAAQTVLFQGFFEAAYGGFVRMYYQKIFKAIAMTPVTIREVLWGELLWDASRASFATVAVLTIGLISGDFSLIGVIACIPFVFAAGLTFAGFGLLCAAWAATIDEISYPQFTLIFPMFLFCGVFFPVERLPGFLQTLVWLMPLTPVVSVFRSLTLGFGIDISAVIRMMFWTATFVYLSRKTMTRRLVK